MAITEFLNATGKQLSVLETHMSDRMGNRLSDCLKFGETSGVETVAMPSQADGIKTIGRV
jgi:hypothetical protein